MPAPITHVVLTSKVFDKYFSGQDRREFFIGTNFPDIRYYDNLDRDKTHKKGMSLNQIVKEGAFLAGAHFHSLVDEKWEKFYQVLKEHPLYLEPYHVTTTAFKFFEDELFYERFKGWEEIAGFFGSALPEEKNFGLAEQDIVNWHGFLREYFSGQPSDSSRRLILQNSGLEAAFVDQVNLFIAQMRQDAKVIGVANDFYDKFERLI